MRTNRIGQVSSLSQLAGQEFPPELFDVTEEQVAEFASAIGDESYIANRAVPPTLAAIYGLGPVKKFLELSSVEPYLSRVIHAEQELTWLRQVQVGETLATTGQISRVRERKGSYFVTIESETRTLDGKLVGTSSSTLVLGGST